MSSQGFGRIVDKAMRAKQWSQRRLGFEIGVLPDGRSFDSHQINLIRQGRRRYYDTMLVERLIDVLDISGDEADEAWREAGVWPADLDVEGYRRFRHMAAIGATSDQPDPKNGRSWRHAGQRRRPELVAA